MKKPAEWTSPVRLGAIEYPVTFKRREACRTWGGWYQHTDLYVGEDYIGRLQERRRPKRPATEWLTDNLIGCVIGCDVRWLLMTYATLKAREVAQCQNS